MPQPESVHYEVGDTVIYNTTFGHQREVVVTKKVPDIGNGFPGFDGKDFRGVLVWGYDEDIVKVIPKK